jgi:hypothetical protein
MPTPNRTVDADPESDPHPGWHPRAEKESSGLLSWGPFPHECGLFSKLGLRCGQHLFPLPLTIRTARRFIDSGFGLPVLIAVVLALTGNLR